MIVPNFLAYRLVNSLTQLLIWTEVMLIDKLNHNRLILDRYLLIEIENLRTEDWKLKTEIQ